MKNTKKWLSLIMAMLLLLDVLGMSDGGCLTVEAASKATVKKVVSVNSLTGSKTIKLAKGRKAVLKTTVTVTPNKSANKKVTYKSSNKKIATVTSKGVITGKKAGTAKITVTSAKNKKKKAVVTVKVVKGKVENIKLSKASGTLFVGDTETLMPNVTVSPGGSKDVVWSTSNKKVATVNKKGTVRAVRAGAAAITVKAADGTEKEATYKVTVKKAKSDNKPKYEYEVNFLSQPYAELITTVYVKTNNPSAFDFSVEFCIANGKWKSFNDIISAQMFEDLKIQSDWENDFYKVDGGYVGTFVMFKDAGKYKVRIKESVGSAKTYADLGYIDVNDYWKEQKEWAQSVIDEVTTDSMTKKEKMQAIERYMYDHSVYDKTASDGSGYVYLAAESGVPFWKFPKYEFNSYTSPALLVQFGDMIDYPMKNLYFEYEMGTPEWSMWHSRVESVEDGSQYFFCHSPDNIIDKSTIKPIDFAKWNFYRCYK